MSGLKMFAISVAVVAALVVSLVWDGSGPESLDSIHVYCAAGIRRPVQAAADEYFKEFGVQVELDFDGSGTLLGKIGEEHRSTKKDKRGDLYLAADESYVDEARARGLVSERVPLARMRPVIAVRHGNRENIRGLDDLLRDGLRVGICNPEQAAVGKTTKEVLVESGHWEELEKRIHVMKPKVTDLANDVKLGSLDAAILWDSTVAMDPDALEAISVPAFDEHAVGVVVAVTSFTKSPPSALRFARYLAAKDRGLEHFKANGFDVVEGDKWEDPPDLVVWSGGVNRLAIENTVEEFQAREGVKISMKYGGCGTLTAEMAPLEGTARFPDIYFACDRSYLEMDRVIDWYGPSVLVAETDMVIVVPKGNPKNIQGLADLGAPGVRLGVADAEKSALGGLTLTLLKEAGIFEKVYRNVTVKAGTADFLVNQIRVTKGNSLDAVIVYQANLYRVLDFVHVVKIDHPAAKAEQPIATSVISKRKLLARRFIDAILSRSSEGRFNEVGFRWRHEGTASE